MALGIRDGCHGLPRLTARLEPWQEKFLADPEGVRDLVDTFGSPLNVHHGNPFDRNVERLRDLARTRGVELQVLFARKANKALVYVERARRIGIGVDTASAAELTQALSMGVRADRLVCTAAVKSVELIRTCIDASVPIVIDGADELSRTRAVALEAGTVAPVFLRVSGFQVQGRLLDSRFGADPHEVLALADSILEPVAPGELRLEGLHFHLDGYAASHRIEGLRRSLLLADALRSRGHPIASIDMGGGFPMRYLEDPKEWDAFRHSLDEALLGRRPPVTRGNDGMGRLAVGQRLVGELGLYPYYQEPVAQEWLAEILDAPSGPPGGTIAEALRTRGLVLRCEPGRSLLDGCGLTVARVEHRKQHRDGSWFVGLAMNRSQCATTKPDHAVDPLLVRPREATTDRTPPVEGFLTGAFCTESDFLSRRRLRFPLGIARGDLVVFPNTAGYLMHFVETRSHQFPLARNVVIDGSDSRVAVPDPIDETG